MNPCSEEEYFHELDKMVIKSKHYLGQLFKTRWRFESGEEWKDEKSYIQNFLMKHCENPLKNATGEQKKILLKSCSLEDWDISWMSMVLLNFGDGVKYKVHNQAVQHLKDLRNILAHHKNKKLTRSEYSEKVKMFKENLQTLGVTKSEINMLMKESRVSSSFEAIERMNVLLENATQLMELQKFESALKIYSEAITIPGLLPVNLGDIYEKRAACYLSIKALDEKYVDQAILDIKHAMELKEPSWSAFYITAQCYRKKNNLLEAIRYYEMALAKSPTQKQIREDLFSCKILNDMQNFNAKLNLDQLPKSLIENAIGADGKLDLENLMKENRKYPGFLGDQYYHGWEVPQDYKKAIKYYSIADKLGDPEGSLKLARAYLHGHGVEQNVMKSFELLKQCAEMNPKHIGRTGQTPLGFNKCIATAEGNIGTFYEEGVCVERDIRQAAFWYTKSMEHGHGEAATNMARLFNNFENGDCLIKRQKRAEMCWKQGMIFNCSWSADHLVDYYRFQLEPEMAWVMLKIAREMGSSKYLKISDKEFKRDYLSVINKSELCKTLKSVTRFEKEKNLGFKGMTLLQRLFRMEQHLDPTMALIRTQESCGGQFQQKNIEDIWNIRFKAGIFHSQTAIQIVETVDKILKLNKLLEVQNDVSQSYNLKVVNLYYECMLLQNHLLIFVTNKDKLREIVAKRFKESCEQIGEDEMKIRLCYIRENLRHHLESSDDLYAIGILKEGLQRYPDNYGYYCTLIDCLKLRRSFDEALQYANEALKKFPEKVDLYHEKADILIRGERKSCEIITAFETFLGKAPRDHRFVPDAYYAISFTHYQEYLKYASEEKPDWENSKKFKLIRKFFECAQDAEKDQLPCYLPYGPSDVQLLVADFLTQFDINSSHAGTMVRAVKEVEEKYYLQSPVRKGLILQHRERLKETFKLVLKEGTLIVQLFPVKLQQHRAQKMSQLKCITLQEMNPNKEKIYENRILDLTIIEDPNPYYAEIEIIAEDENGDTTRVYIDKSKSNYDMNMFKAGCKFAVINPYMWTKVTKGINGIRVNEPKCIVRLEKAKEMCRYCGDENATHKCPNCERVYCSKDCYMLDRTVFDHDNICFVTL